MSKTLHEVKTSISRSFDNVEPVVVIKRKIVLLQDEGAISTMEAGIDIEDAK